MSYAEHQEEAARALNDLITEEMPLERLDEVVVLECRRHVLAACGERLRILGSTPGEPHQRSPSVATVAKRPLKELSNVLAELPVTPPSRAAPSELLPGPSAEDARSAVDRWRCAARNLALANHALTTANDQPWIRSDASRWHLIGDAAAVVEAVLLLDNRLGARGLLPHMTNTATTARRLVAGDVSRLSRWFGTDPAADLSHSSPLTELGLFDGPRIRMVPRPEDMAAAQRSLTALLRHRRNDPDTSPRVGIRAARVVSTGQVRLAEAFATWSEAHEDGQLLADQFRARIPALLALHKSTTRLVETVPARSALAVAQQSEMIGQLRRFPDASLSRDALLDLNQATHEVTTTLGRSLRREGRHRKSILVLQHEDLGPPTPRLIWSERDPFQEACKSLADDPAPIPHEDRRPAPVHRERLRKTLDRQPATTPPTPRRPAPVRAPARSDRREPHQLRRLL